MTTDAELFSKNTKSILSKAGLPLSYEEAADLLKSTPQEVFKRATAHEIVAVMHEGAAVIPSIQFKKTESGYDVVPGVSQLLKDFTSASAGTWSALQFLTQPDGNLQGQSPIEVLKTETPQALQSVRHATLAYLD